MKFTSAPHTFIFKYIFPVFMLVGSGLAIVVFKNSDDPALSEFANAVGIAFIWISIFLIQMPFRVKKIMVDEDGLTILSRSGQESIPFDNICSVSKFDLSNPWFMTIKYIDKTKNKTRKISYLPHQKHQRFMKQDEMTEYLVTQSRKYNPNYEDVSVIKNMIIVFLAGLPFFIGMLYFMCQSGLQNF